jgi:hypothetical protein
MSVVSFEIDEMHPNHWDMVRSIYLDIATGNATFEAEAPDWETGNHLTSAES